MESRGRRRGRCRRVRKVRRRTSPWMLPGQEVPCPCEPDQVRCRDLRRGRNLQGGPRAGQLGSPVAPRHDRHGRHCGEESHRCAPGAQCRTALLSAVGREEHERRRIEQQHDLEAVSQAFPGNRQAPQGPRESQGPDRLVIKDKKPVSLQSPPVPRTAP